MWKNTKKLYRIHVETNKYVNAITSFIHAGYRILEVKFTFNPNIMIFCAYGDMLPDEVFSDNIDAITTDGKNVIFYNWY